MSYARNTIALEPNPFRGWGAYASCDANRIHVDADGRLVVFHTTTPERAAEIIASGPKAHAVRVGFGGEHRAPAFWVNCVPWVPYSVEQFHPTFGADQDMAVIACTIDANKAFGWLKIDPSWPFAQWGVPVEAVENLQIVPPEDFWTYRSTKARNSIVDYIRNGIEEKLLPADGYAAVLAEVIPQ